MIISKWLVIRAGDQSARIVTNQPTRLALDEITCPITIVVPDEWARPIEVTGPGLLVEVPPTEQVEVSATVGAPVHQH